MDCHENQRFLAITDKHFIFYRHNSALIVDFSKIILKHVQKTNFYS